MKRPLITEWAYAKVNLCLHVTGQRADGYHLLDSIVAFAGIGDQLHAGPSGVSSLTLEGRFGADLPSDMNNMVLRAAKAFDPDFPVAFTLKKNLPPASGIGGGSADAAAAVRAMIRLQVDGGDTSTSLSAGFDRPAIRALGADVPVCMMCHPARMRGVGEELDYLGQLPGGGIVLVNPLVQVPTPSVFAALAQKENPPLPDTLPQWRDMAALAQWLHGTRNDLEVPAVAIAPVIADVLAALRAVPQALLARMSGSGATCFALFADETGASHAATQLQTAHPSWWVAAGPLYPGNPDFATVLTRAVQEIRATT